MLRRLLEPTGALVIVGADHVGGPLLDGVDRQLRALLLNPWVRHRLAASVQRETGADVDVVLEHLAEGRITAAVEQVVPLDGAIEAIGRLQRREVSGKIVIGLG